MICVSIVSHAHGNMVAGLVEALLAYSEVRQILVTRNVEESLQLPADERIEVIANARPQGFAANHNAAFSRCDQPFFCVLNPDIRLHVNPFPALIAALESAENAVAAPLVVNAQGGVEDSVRHFPTPFSLLLKALGRSDGRYPVGRASQPFAPEWVAGMFMLFRRTDYDRVRGFDEGFFLYYEDVDICARIWKAGSKVVFVPAAVVEHDARRDSRRKPEYLRFHLASMIRYFFKHLGRLPAVPGTFVAAPGARAPDRLER